MNRNEGWELPKSYLPLLRKEAGEVTLFRVATLALYRRNQTHSPGHHRSPNGATPTRAAFHVLAKCPSDIYRQFPTVSRPNADVVPPEATVSRAYTGHFLGSGANMPPRKFYHNPPASLRPWLTLSLACLACRHLFDCLRRPLQEKTAARPLHSLRSRLIELENLPPNTSSPRLAEVQEQADQIIKGHAYLSI
ncbi:hypothetical protein Bbelb_073530 [Branchiostoma belcheri]|nr:hypothetical protein Bbelb_073530 [Branchiostoma belcheri]